MRDKSTKGGAPEWIKLNDKFQEVENAVQVEPYRSGYAQKVTLELEANLVEYPETTITRSFNVTIMSFEF